MNHHHHPRGCNANAACASCKHQRKKCDERCLLSPYFPADKFREFQAVHRVFGVSNVTKMMIAVSEADRASLVESLVYEALLRLRDPVLGIYGEYQKCLDEVVYFRNLAQSHVLQIQQLQAEIKRITNNGGTTGNNNNVVGVCHVGGTSVAASPGLVGWNSNRGNNPVGNLNLGRAGLVGAATNDGNVRATQAHENESCIIDAIPFGFRMEQHHLDIKDENQEQELASTAGVVRPQSPPMGGFKQQYYMSVERVGPTMAQLPPKIPNMPPIWQEFSKLPHHHPYSAVAVGAGNYNGNGNGNPSWVDEFLDFSSARRGAHRRSASDSVGFLESPLLENCRGVAAIIPCSAGGNAGGEFDRFDDEQFMSMFTDEISPSVVVPTLSSSNPSSPSDYNSNNEEKQGTLPLQQQIHPKDEPEELQSPFESDYQVTAATDTTTEDALNESTERIIDPKRVKRILANRQSAQRSRVRKLQYISELERSVNTLQAEVSMLSPSVAFLDQQRLLLNVDNSALKQRIAALAQDKIFKDAHQEALKREIERLRQVYHQQNMLKTDNDEEGSHHDVECSNEGAAAAGSPPPHLSSDPGPPLPEKEQIISA